MDKIEVTQRDILNGDDGMSVFWPDGRNGAFTARHLRAIADEMDKRDAPLVKSTNRYLRAQRICDSDRVMSVFAASEWSELGDDGREWILAIIDEVDAQAMTTPPATDVAALVEALKFYAGLLSFPYNAWVQPSVVDYSKGGDGHHPDGPPIPSDTLLLDRGKHARQALAPFTKGQNDG